MWSFVWLLPALFAAAAGVYVNTPCIRSLLKCSPFRLSLLDGKFSDSFIEDHIILRRQCRSMDAFLECMQETALMHCNNITPAEEKFIKTRLYVAEVCNDVNNMRKAYFKSAACINRQMNRVHEACFPDYYVELVNTSNLISLEGSCVLQTLLISCRKDVIREICGPEAGDLYGRVKAVDMNLDFLCLERRDLQSPEFLLDVTINSYISLLIEIMRPVLRMERNFHQGIEETKEDEIESPQLSEEGEGCLESKDFSVKKRTKIPPRIQDLPNNNWRRSGDIPPNLEAVCAGDEAGTPVCAGVEAESTSMYAGDEAESIVYFDDEAESTVYAGEEAVVDPGNAPSTSSSGFNTNEYSSLDCFIILENVTLDNLHELEAEQNEWDDERLKAFDECLEKLMDLETQAAVGLSKKVLNGLTALFAPKFMEIIPGLFTGHIKGSNLTKREGEVVLPVTELGRAQHSISHEFKRETQAGTPACAGDEAESTVYAGDEAESTVYAGDEAESTVYAGDEAESTVYAGDEAESTVYAGDEAESTVYAGDEAESTVYAGDEAESTVYAGDEAESTVYAGDEAVVDPGSAPSTSSSEFNTNEYSSLDCFIILENITLDNLHELEAKQNDWDDERLKAFDECLEKLMDLETQAAVVLSKKVLNGLTALFAPKFMEIIPSLFTGHIKENNLTKREGEVVLPVTELGRAQHSISHEFKRETQSQSKVEQTVKESIGGLMTSKSLAGSRVTLNYVLIGESYIPIEINYVDGSEAKSFHHNLKISGKKFKFFTSTPAISPTFTDSDSCVNEPSNVLIKSAEETSEIKSGFDEESSEFSCPSSKSNKTPEVSNFRASEQESELNKHFYSLNYKGDSVEETEHVSGESFKNDFSGKTEESSEVANKDIRRSGDIEDGPNKVLHQGIDLETTIALKFYGELLTELLTSDNSEAKEFLKRASDVMDAYRNYLKGNKEANPHTFDTTLPTVDVPESKVFQKRSMDTDDSFNQKQNSPKTTLNKDSTREMGLRFDVKHTPESLVRIEMYVSEEKSPDVKYLVMGEYKVPLEIHFDVQNKSYVHYTEVDIPERTLKVDVQMSQHPPMTEDEIRASGNLEELAV